MSQILLENLDKLHTTPLGKIRVQKNLVLKTDDVVLWCQREIQKALAITKKGKNWYVYTTDAVITVNAFSYTVITAHRRKEKK